MKPAAIVAALCCLVVNGLTQVKPTPALQPTKLEAFAEQPAAHIAWSKVVGRIDSDDTQAVITALIFEDWNQPSHRMRGIRIDLANKNATDHVYLEDGRLEAIKRALETIEGEIESFRKEPADAPYRYRGAAEFWHPHLKVHTLNAAYYIAPDSSGLSVSAYKNQEFRFPNHRPSELAAGIGRAIAALKQR